MVRCFRALIFLAGANLLLLTLWMQVIHKQTPFYFLSYLADGSGRPEIYLADANGTNPQQRTYHKGHLGVCWYDWAATGREIFLRWDETSQFTCLTGQSHYANLALQSRSYEAQNYSSAVRSPDEQWLIRTELDSIRGYAQYIYVMDRNGESKKLLQELEPHGRVDVQWRGESLVFSQSSSIGRFFFRLKPFEQQVIPLRLESHFTVICQNWSLSPDGHTLYLLVMDRRGWCNEFYAYDLRTGAYEKKQTFDLSLQDVVRWSPDGKTLAYWDILEDKLYLISAETGQSHLVKGFRLFPYTEYAGGDWSPDGEWLVMTAFVGGNNLGVYRVRADGTGLKALTSAAQNSVMPRFSPAFSPSAFNPLLGLLGILFLGLGFRA